MLQILNVRNPDLNVKKKKKKKKKKNGFSANDGILIFTLHYVICPITCTVKQL